jgi:ATP synthase protein I
VSRPPDYPGRERLKKGLSRKSTQAGGDAYQGAFEAVGAVLFACGVGYWIDGRWGTSPWGLLIGVVLGFAAMVLRLVRLGKELHPDDSPFASDERDGKEEQAKIEGPIDEGLGVGLAPGMSEVLREDEDVTD